MSSDYFSAPAERPTESGAYHHVDELPALGFLAGLTLRPLLATGVLVSFVDYEPRGEAPWHAHVEQQIFVMLEGELEVDLDGDVRTVRRGDVVVIPAWVPHRVTAGAAPASQIDIFCPPRQGVLDQLAVLGLDGGA